MEMWQYVCNICDRSITCPKDEFLLPITDVMIDNTCGLERMSFMDGFSGYNQIKMHPDDEKHTSFWTPLDVFCYTIMSFGLKNAGAIYQHAMSVIFRDHLRKTVECYVDDIAIKSCEQLSPWPEDDVRSHAGSLAEDEPDKVFLESFKWQIPWIHYHVQRSWPWQDQSIQDMQPLKNLKELRGLQGRLAYIRRFIVNLSGHSTVYTVNEEGHVFCLGWHLSEGFWGYQRIPH